MIARRTMLALIAGLALIAPPAAAQSWKQKYPELVMALVPSENATGVLARVGPFADYLTKELGVKVTLRVANDYTAVIEGQKNRQIHIGQYGPGSYARANTVSGGNVVPFATLRNSGGVIGYYSVMWVRADSPYKTLNDLKGKTLGLVDVESTSGFKAPTFFLADQGFPIDKNFKLAQTTGSHENAIFALAGGTVDAAVNWWNAEGDSNLDRMITKGGIKKDRRHRHDHLGFSHHLEIPDASGVSVRPPCGHAGGFEGRHHPGVSRRSQEEQAGIRCVDGRQSRELCARLEGRLRRVRQDEFMAG